MHRTVLHRRQRPVRGRGAGLRGLQCRAGRHTAARPVYRPQRECAARSEARVSALNEGCPMSAAPSVNRRIVLARRPKGAPSAEDFRLESQPVPAPEPNQVLLRTRYLSLDPYMRGRMNEGRSYVAPVALGAPMTGQTVSVVEHSNIPAFKGGDLVLANVGWQDYGLSDGSDLGRIDGAMTRAS